MRPYPTKEGSLLKNGVERKSFEQIAGTLTALTSKARNRPVVAFSTMCGVLQILQPILLEGQKQKLLGNGLDLLFDFVTRISGELDICNTFWSC